MPAPEGTLIIAHQMTSLNVMEQILHNSNPLSGRKALNIAHCKNRIILSQQQDHNNKMYILLVHKGLVRYTYLSNSGSFSNSHLNHFSTALSQPSIL